MHPQEVSFVKYQGAGNDFILIDNRAGHFLREDTARYQRWCDRKFGVGADGLIFIQDKAGYDFEMVYYNADGSEGSMCGNGGRCAVMYAALLGIITEKTNFLATDGPHVASLMPHGWVSLGMKDVDVIESIEGDFFTDTGSPHHVRWVKDLANYPVSTEGEAIRWRTAYQPGGTNVNFAEETGDHLLSVRTFERGVEAETLACGTGVTACALVYASQHALRGAQLVEVQTPGGMLAIRFEVTDKGFRNIQLQGPATAVFSGKLIDKF